MAVSFRRYMAAAFFVLVLAFTLGLVFQSSVSAQASGEKQASSAASGDVAAGKELFQGKLGCYGCHGREGGGGMGPSLADGQWIYGGDEASITESITNGRAGGMPAFGGNATPEEISNVVAFVMSLSKAK